MAKAKQAAGWQNRIVGEGVEAPDQLLANPANWRIHPKHQQDALSAVLDNVGWVQRVIINRTTGHIVDGHLRVSLAISRNEAEVPVVYVDLTEDEELTVLATIDPLSAMAATDSAKLAELLASVQTDDAALDAVLRGVGETAGLDMGSVIADAPDVDVDRAEELRAKWGVEYGDLWRVPSKHGGEHRILCGDSTNAADVARVMEDELAALAWFDPPFGIALKPQRQHTDEIKNDGNAAARELWARFLPLLDDALATDAHVFLCQQWSEFDWTLPLVRCHFKLKSKIVWSKNVWGIGYYTRPQHEDVIYCWKGTPDKPAVPVSDVWQIARENAPIHAAEKPAELSSIAIETFTERAAIVADWFSGVGGSTIACEQHGRQSRAIEIDPRFIGVTLERLSLMGLTPEREAADG